MPPPRRLNPPPDNILLITDGLPTQGRTPPRGGTVSGKERLRLFERAVQALPRRAPVNTLLLPMEGDPMAAPAFWKLAMATRRVVHGSVARLAMKRARRTLDPFSLSFLDCICCGFGAIILLLTLTRMSEPRAIEAAQEDLEGRIARLEREIFEIRGESTVLERALRGKREQLSTERVAVARLQGDLSRLQGEFKSSRELSQVQDIVAGRMLAAQQELTEEMKRLQAERDARAGGREAGGRNPGGQRVRGVHHRHLGQHAALRLAAAAAQDEPDPRRLPEGEGAAGDERRGRLHVLVLRGQVDPRHPGAPQGGASTASATWTPFSNSSPVEGIEAAIRTLGAGTQKISLYVLGDEFTGPSIERVLDEVDRLNARGAQGGRRVRIHGIGFPTLFGQSESPENTTIRFSILMRALCERNGGTFVGLNSLNP